MTDPLRVVCDRAERPDPEFDADELARWPDGAQTGLEQVGLLAAARPSTAAACDSCGVDHVEPVVWADAPGRPRRAFIVCRAVGRVPVNPDRLRRWAVSVPTLARLVADAVGASGGATERVPGRVWRLGTVRVGGRVRVGWLALGLRRPDGPAVVGSAPELRSPSALVFVPAAVPSMGVWPCDRHPPVVSLADVLSFGSGGLVCDQLALESALTPAAGPVGSAVEPIPMLPGGRWEDVALVVEDRHLRVRVGDGERRVGFAEAGFADGRKKETPNQVWALLTRLARAGALSSPDRVTTKSGSLKRGMTRLRGALRGLTGIADDPFHPVGRGGSYRARFRVRAAEGAVFPVPAGATWERVAVTEVAPGVVAAAVEAEAVGVAFGPGDDRGGRGRWEATTEAAERTARYPVAEVGLTRPARDALLAVLRAGGTVRRPATDPGMLALGQGLSRFLPVGGPPFEFRRGAWVAKFEARSLVPASDR